MIILFRTCGGLGNQLYQLFFCKLISIKYNTTKIRHFHSTNYERYAEWEVPLELSKVENFFYSFLIKLRIPTLLFRLGLNKSGYFNFFNLILIDNYYQHKDFYELFNKNEIVIAIEYIRGLTIIDKKDNIKDEILYHFRLGDFFENTQDEMNYIEQNLMNVPDGSTIISNKDDLFNNSQELSNFLKNKNCRYLDSSHMNAVELLNLFYHYKLIYSNGSSLSYFAATLSNSDVLPISESNNKYQEDSIRRLEDLKKIINN